MCWRIQQLVQDVNIPSTLQGFNIPASALEQLTEDATKQTRILARSPMPLEREDIYQIYQAAFAGVVREP